MNFAHWEHYYQSGSIASCPTTADGDYDRELRTVWESFLAPLPEAARVLDVGTGNGAIAAIAQALALRLQRHWQIHACDAATIDPVRHVADGVSRFQDVQFHSNIASEHLPFSDASFDAVTGQYALEWSVPTLALPEIARVLKPGAHALFVLANADAAMVQSARIVQRDASRVFDEWKVFTQLRQLLATPQLSAADAQRQGLALQALIQEIKQALENRRGKESDWLLALTLEAIRTLLDQRRQLPPEDMPTHIDHIERELRHGARRLGELADYACDEARMQAIEHWAITAGLQLIERAPHWYAGRDLVGWRLHLARA
ncbi:MAG: class I SAM-dependent methyltransferase [Thermomonas haemolytica]